MELANGDADGSMIPAARCESTSFLMTSRIVAFVLFILGRPLNVLSVVILQCMLGGTLVSPVVNEMSVTVHECLHCCEVFRVVRDLRVKRYGT